MKKLYALALLAISLLVQASAQDTFSIIAVDPETGEVGAAGASCIDTDDCGGCGGVIIINDLIPGRGGINAQAQVCLPNVNLNNGINQLEAGLSPQEALNWLLANDACIFGNATNRQYGIADLDPEGNPRSAGYTGANCFAYANHNTGDNYSIQGNILLGQEILDSMEQRFLNTTGSLAERLMSALQGANVPGADTRCLSLGISSKSAFIRVAKPDDTAGDFYLELNVPSVLPGVDPIDSLQTLFDEWLVSVGVAPGPALQNGFRTYPNPAGSELYIEALRGYSGSGAVRLFDMTGRLTREVPLQGLKTTVPMADLYPGLFFLEVRDDRGKLLFTDKIAH